MEQKRKMKIEINDFLENIRKRTMYIIDCHTIWLYLRENTDEEIIGSIYTKYLEFFEVIRVSLFKTIIVDLSTLFDKDGNSISFHNLKKIVYPNEKLFTSKTINYNELHKKGRKLWDFRSKAIAHCDKKILETDFLKETKLTFNDLQLIIYECLKLIKEFFTFCNKTFTTRFDQKSNISQLFADLSNMNKNNT